MIGSLSSLVTTLLTLVAVGFAVEEVKHFQFVNWSRAQGLCNFVDGSFS